MATLSDATMYSGPSGVSRRPRQTGRMPCGSRKATMPWPRIMRDDGVAAPAATVHAGDGGEDGLRRELAAVLALQFVGEHVEQRLGVGTGVQVAPVVIDQELLQLAGVGQIAVVREADAVRRIDVERLGLGGTGASRRRVARVADAHVALQAQHVTFLEYVLDQAERLAAVERAVRRRS